MVNKMQTRSKASKGTTHGAKAAREMAGMEREAKKERVAFHGGSPDGVKRDKPRGKRKTMRMK